MHPHVEPAAKMDDAGEPPTLENQVRWLREAGFDEVECFSKEGQQTIIAAYRHA